MSQLAELKKLLIQSIKDLLERGSQDSPLTRLMDVIRYDVYDTWWDQFHLFNEGGLKTMFFHVGKEVLRGYLGVEPSAAEKYIRFDALIKEPTIRLKEEGKRGFRPDVIYYQDEEAHQPIALIEVCQTWDNLREKLAKYSRAEYDVLKPLLVFAGLGFAGLGLDRKTKSWERNQELLVSEEEGEGALYYFKKELRRCLELYNDDTLRGLPKLLMGLTFIFWWHYDDDSGVVRLRPLRPPLWRGFNEELLQKLPETLSL